DGTAAGPGAPSTYGKNTPAMPPAFSWHSRGSLHLTPSRLSQNGEALHRPGLRPGLGLPPDIRSPHPYRVHPLTNGIRLSGSGAPSGTRGAPRRLESPIERRLPRASGYALSWYLAAHARTRTGEEASPVPAFFGRSIKALETL